MAKLRVLVLVILSLVASSCAETQPPPEALPLRGWDGEEIDDNEDLLSSALIGDDDQQPTAYRVTATTTTTRAPITATSEPERVDLGDLTYGSDIEAAFGDELAMFSNNELICINDELDKIYSDSAPAFVYEFGRLCAPDKFVELWADLTVGADVINLPSRADRVCFAKTVTFVANKDIVDSFGWYPRDRFSPPSDERVAIGGILTASCRFDQATILTAGLRPLADAERHPKTSSASGSFDSVASAGFVRKVDKISFGSDWSISANGSSDLAEGVDEMFRQDRQFVNLEVRAMSTVVGRNDVDGLWGGVNQAMSRAGFVLDEGSACNDGAASNIRVFGPGRSATTGAALVSYFPDGPTYVVIAVMNPADRDPTGLEQERRRLCPTE